MRKTAGSGNTARERTVERLRRSEIAAERLLGHDASASRATRAAQLPDHGREQTGGNRQIVQRPLRRSQRRAAADRTSPDLRSRRPRSAASDESLSKAAPSTPPPWVSRLSLARALSWSRVQPALATPMTGTFRWPALHHRLQGREDLLVREVPGRAEEDQRIGRVRRHHCFSSCPPNSYLMAESNLSAKSSCAAGGEALRQRGAQDRRGDALVDGRLQRPAPLARVGHAAGEPAEVGTLLERRGREVEEPGTDYASVPPCLDDVRQVQVVLVELRVPQRRRLGIGRARGGPDVGMAKNVEPFGIRRHDPVLDPVVNHLDEVSRTGWSAVDVAALGGAVATRG